MTSVTSEPATPSVTVFVLVTPLAHRLVRMRCHQPTKDYIARRTAEGKTKTEIMRCLKRYIARETYPLVIKHSQPVIEPVAVSRVERP